MRWTEIAEMASMVPDGNRGRIFYHGTSSTVVARLIMKKGLQPPDNGNRNGHLTPVQGMVYLTPSLGYALIYAAGGNYIGNASYRIPYRGENKEKFDRILTNRAGVVDRYGYVFCVSGDAMTMTQPDEDHVGELYHYVLAKRDPNPAYHDADFLRAWEALKGDPRRWNMFSQHMGYHTTDRQKNGIEQGFVSYYASGGKRAIARMSDEMKTWLCSIGLHVANQGAIMPTECWRFDKTKIGWLDKDGGNFFESAKKIWSKAA